MSIRSVTLDSICNSCNVLVEHAKWISNLWHNCDTGKIFLSGGGNQTVGNTQRGERSWIRGLLWTPPSIQSSFSAANLPGMANSQKVENEENWSLFWSVLDKTEACLFVQPPVKLGQNGVNMKFSSVTVHFMHSGKENTISCPFLHLQVSPWAADGFQNLFIVSEFLKITNAMRLLHLANV